MIRKVVFLVEGQTEAASFKKKFFKVYKISPHLRTIKCNGKTVTAQTYANKSKPTVLLCLNDMFKKIVCVIDRERRREDVKTLASEFKKAIIEGVLADSANNFLRKDLENKIRVCFADRMFENWILADVEGLKSSNLIKSSAKQDGFEGENGVNLLNKLMSCKYRKIEHAPTLFEFIRFSSAKKNSQSFLYFLNLFSS